MKKNFKSQKGIAGADALVAISILILFVGLISTLTYNIYIASTGIKRQATAIEYIKNIFSYIEKNNYDDIDVNSIYQYALEDDDLSNGLKNKIIISSNAEETETNTVKGNTAYTINVSVEKLNKQDGNLDKLDLVMKVTVKIEYKIGNKDKSLEMYTIKSKEKNLVPNKPDLTLLSDKRTDNDNIYAIKKENNTWKVTTASDSEWYNYFSGIWANILITDKELEVGDTVGTLEEGESVYVWIPKFAYLLNGSTLKDLVFLYRNTLKYVGEDSTLVQMETNYVKNIDANGFWLNIDDIDDNNSYKYLKQKYGNNNLFEK